MQLVGPLVCFYDFESGAKGKPGYRPERNLDEAAVTEKWEGMPPEKIGDVLALMGDTSDNVPGVPGHRPQDRRAAHQGIRRSRNAACPRGRDQAAEAARNPDRQCRHGAALEAARDARLRGAAARCRSTISPCPSSTAQALIAFLKAMEFNTLTRRVADLYEADRAAIEPDPRLLPGGEAIRWERAGRGRRDPLLDSEARGTCREHGARPTPPPPRVEGSVTPSQLAAQRATEASSQPFDVTAYETITSLERAEGLGRAGARAGLSWRSTRDERTRREPRRSRRHLAGARRRARPPTCRFSIAAIPTSSAAASCRARSRSATRSTPCGRCSRIPSVLKIGQNVKYDWVDPQAPRHRGAALRRHDADLLRARRRQGSARHGRTCRGAISATRRSLSARWRAPARQGDASTGRDSTRRRPTRRKTPTSPCAYGRC